jgi:hypothetical protein
VKEFRIFATLSKKKRAEGRHSIFEADSIEI